jgi:hypothetical protein
MKKRKAKVMKHKEFEKVRKLAKDDPSLQEVLDFAQAGNNTVKELTADKPTRIRVPYVNSPSLLERSWK